MRFAYLTEPPFNYRDEVDNITGCDVELARCIFDQIGVRDAVFVEATFAELLPGLALGYWEMTTGLFATKLRQEHALFSRPIWALPDGLLVRSEDAHRISGYGDLADNDAFSLAVVRDQIQMQSALDLGVKPDRIKVFETYWEAAVAVQSGQVSASASVARAHDGYLQGLSTDLACIVVPLAEKAPAYGSFGFTKTNPDFKAVFDGVLAQFIGGDAHRRLMIGFGFSNDDVDLLL
ncbi:MAG: transporter substrate-binding domain-containing protein [Roseobacter sp.]